MKFNGFKIGEFIGVVFIITIALVVVRGMWLSLWYGFVP